MHAFISIAALAAILPALAAPTSGNVPITKFPGSVKANSYIIKLKDGVSKDAHLSQIISSFTAGSSLQYKYGDVFHGYAITLKGKDLDFIRQSKDIEYIEEDGIVSIDFQPGDASELTERSAEPIAARATGGAGVDIYGIDTGIYTAHSQFGGRAKWGATYGGYANADGNGHGTHTAGTAIGSTYGQAPSANAIAVKVLSDSGSGSNSDVISGVNYAYNAFKASGRPSIATMSLGGSAYTALDTAVSTAIAGGLHFTIAAGNSNVDASTTSPARVSGAVTVGAVDSSNKKASFSNYGSIVDIQAPGVNILSAWIGSTTASNTISGTSMATPFVAGILAFALGEYGQVTPASLSASLKSHALAVVTGEPSGTTNLLATKW
ncbi:putative subtilisin-like serine protease [Ceratobasidium sp. AG-I]|nr:putative subtilisin-like serine protease [Ceratobasidium sp. AG-I]